MSSKDSLEWLKVCLIMYCRALPPDTPVSFNLSLNERKGSKKFCCSVLGNELGFLPNSRKVRKCKILDECFLLPWFFLFFFSFSKATSSLIGMHGSI